MSDTVTAKPPAGDELGVGRNCRDSDPLLLNGVCTDGVLQAECVNLADSTRSKAAVCSILRCADSTLRLRGPAKAAPFLDPLRVD